jgi:hypothetical protein
MRDAKDLQPTPRALAEYAQRTRTKHRRTAMWFCGIALTALIVMAYAKGPEVLLLAVLLPLIVGTWMLSTQWNLKTYVLLLGIQIPQSMMLLRVGVADFFMYPAIVRTALTVLRTRSWPLRTTLMGPSAAFVALMTFSLGVAYLHTGTITSYALLNKAGGMAFLVAASLTIAYHLRTEADVRRCADAFITGASCLNIVAIFAAGAAKLFGLWSPLYPDSGRLNGLLMNPSAYGILVSTVALIELARLADRTEHDVPLRAVRWCNVSLLLLATALTMSRSNWLSLSAGSGVLLVFWRLFRRERPPIPLHLWSTLAATMIVPAAVVGWIGLANAGTMDILRGRTASIRAAELQQQIASMCAAKRDVLACHEASAAVIKDIPHTTFAAGVPASSAAGHTKSRTRVEPAKSAPAPQPTAQPRAARVVAPPAVAPRVVPPGAARTDGALMNARGLDDRMAILSAAWGQYRAGPATIFFGLGLGVFYATSGPTFGVPLIIHNTLAWLLVEFGPLGLVAVAWLLGRTGLNLWRMRTLPDWRGNLNFGLAAAITAWLVFSMFNEALYMRQFWVLLVIADRLYVLSDPRAEQWTTR